MGLVDLVTGNVQRLSELCEVTRSDRGAPLVEHGELDYPARYLDCRYAVQRALQICGPHILLVIRIVRLFYMTFS